VRKLKTKQKIEKINTRKKQNYVLFLFFNNMAFILTVK